MSDRTEHRRTRGDRVDDALDAGRSEDHLAQGHAT
jgi:hypothetical protein